MRAKLEERQVAETLRRGGLSLAAIARQVPVSKGTLSVWLRGIEFDEGVISPTTEHRRKWSPEAHALVIEKNERTRESEMAAAAESIGSLSDRDLLLLLAALYWGEGYKATLDEFALTNSDPIMIRLVVDIVRRLGVPDEAIKGKIIGYTDIDKSAALDWWAKESRIKQDAIRYYAYSNRASQGKYRVSRPLRFGTFTVLIHRATFARRVHGWLRGLTESAAYLHTK